MNDYSDQRQGTHGNPHAMLACQRSRFALQIKNCASDPASKQDRPKDKADNPPLQGGLQVILMSVTQDAVEFASMLSLKVGKDNCECARPESEPPSGTEREPANAIDRDSALPDRPSF